MKYSEISEQIAVVEKQLKSNLEIVKKLKEQKEKIMYYWDLVIVNRGNKEEIRVLDEADKKVLCKQIDKEINTYTNQIGNLNIQIEALKEQRSFMYEDGGTTK